MNIVLVISVHPDDETLGCGGTIFKHINNGDKVYCTFVTGGNEKQKKIISKIARKYNFTKYFEMNFDELVLDDLSLNVLIPSFASIFDEVKPSIMYIPNRSDIHSDHRKVYEAVVSASKSFRAHYIKKTLMCEVISETDFSPALIENSFIPNVFVDVSETFKNKMEVVRLFESELLVEPFTRSYSSIEALSRYRGSQINTEYAEAFMLLKEIL